MGRALLLDGVWMTAEGDEATYHEMLSHPAIVTAHHLEKVLIIGGGDGGTAREVLRHPEVQEVELVELDGRVIEASKNFLPTIGSSWKDPRLHIKLRNGIEHMKAIDTNSVDVIIIDGSDPIGPAEGLFDRTFYENCKRALKPGGVLTTHAESPLLMRDWHLNILNALGEVFDNVHPYYGGVAIYPGGSWAWAFASQDVDPKTIREDRLENIEEDCIVYNEDIHRGAFAIPNYIKKALHK